MATWSTKVLKLPIFSHPFLQNDIFNFPQLHGSILNTKHNKILAICVVWRPMKPNACHYNHTWRLEVVLKINLTNAGASFRSLFFTLTKSVLVLFFLATNTAGQFTLSGCACKECPFFVPVLGLQPSFPFKNLSHIHTKPPLHTLTKS